MMFDIEKYENAILSEDHTRRVNAGLELAEVVSTLSAEELERFSQSIVDLLLEALRGTDWEFRNLISNALVIIGKQDSVAKSTWFWKKLIATYRDTDAGLRSSAMDLLKELGRSDYSLEILEPLIEGLQYSDKDTRILSANTLGRIRAKEVVPMLIEALHDENANVVYNVVECLGDIGDRRAVPALLELLQDPPDDWVQVATLEALGKIGDQRAVNLLLSMVNREFMADPLLNALGILGDSRAIPTLMDYVKDDERDIRQMAIKAVVTIWEEVESVADFTGVWYELEVARRVLNHTMTGYVKSIVMGEMTDENSPQELRENCATLLSCIGYRKALGPVAKLLEASPLSNKLIMALVRYKTLALSHVLPLLEHSDDRVRQSGALYLQHLVQHLQSSNTKVRQALVQLVEDEHPILKQIAVESLAQLRNPTTLPTFLAVLQKEPEAFGDTITAILSRFPKRSVSNLVLSQMNEEDEKVLPHYLKILGHTRARLETLRQYFKHPNPYVQEASILAIGFTGNPEGIPLLLPFIMSRQHTQARCAAALSLNQLVLALGTDLPKPKNIFEALFVMLNTYRNEEELSAVARTLGTLCSYRYQDITELNIAVVRGRLLDLLTGVSKEAQIQVLQALQGIIDISSYSVIRKLRRANTLEIQRIIAMLYGRFEKDLRVIADIAEMISHSEFSIRKFWILTAGTLRAIELTDMLVPLLADQNFRVEAFQALTMMGTALLPRLEGWLHHDDPRIKKMAALVLSKIAQEHIDKFCTIPSASR